jgi:hypothetical protein
MSKTSRVPIETNSPFVRITLTTDRHEPQMVLLNSKSTELDYSLILELFQALTGEDICSFIRTLTQSRNRVSAIAALLRSPSPQLPPFT